MSSYISTFGAYALLYIEPHQIQISCLGRVFFKDFPLVGQTAKRTPNRQTSPKLLQLLQLNYYGMNLPQRQKLLWQFHHYSRVGGIHVTRTPEIGTTPFEQQIRGSTPRITKVLIHAIFTPMWEQFCRKPHTFEEWNPQQLATAPLFSCIPPAAMQRLIKCPQPGGRILLSWNGTLYRWTCY